VKPAVLLLAAVSTLPAFAQQQLPPVQYSQVGAALCPTDLDLRNLDVRLSSVINRPGNEQSVRSEQRKAVLCRTTGSRYTDKDWRQLRAVLRGEQ